MKTKVKKLRKVLKTVESCECKRAVELVYLSIVFLGYKIPKVAKYFKLSEANVQASLIKCGVRLKKDKEFKEKMQKAVRVYNVDENLKLVA